jgi:hypothetical protein
LDDAGREEGENRRKKMLLSLGYRGEEGKLKIKNDKKKTRFSQRKLSAGNTCFLCGVYLYEKLLGWFIKNE